MDDNFQLLDILFLAVVAGFLIMRLRNVLGKRGGYEQTPDEMSRRKPDSQPDSKPDSKPDNVVDINRARQGDDTFEDVSEYRPVLAPIEGEHTAQGLAEIQDADPSFDAQGFLGGAQNAFEMIVVAFAEARLDDIQPYLGDEVFANFKAGVQELQAAGETAETQIISIKSAVITEASLQERNAVIAVKFVSEQVNIIRGADGEVVDGDPNFIETLTDVWTFGRDVTSESVNWKLMVTRSIEG